LSFGQRMKWASQVISFMLMLLICDGRPCWALAANNIPLDSQAYVLLEKLAGFGLIKSDFKGIRPYSKAEVARLMAEAEGNLPALEGASYAFADKLIRHLEELFPREVSLRKWPDKAPFFDVNPIAEARYRYVYLDGIPRSYERPVHDPGGDGVFGIGSGLRPDNPFPSLIQHHGTEGTPLFENNEGLVYREGHNHEFRFAGEAYLKGFASALIEPLFLASSGNDAVQFRLNKGYVKVGGGALELEVGRDANWLGLGFRGNVTLTNNARNFDLFKLSSPEPFHLKHLGDFKYTLIFSRFDRTFVDGRERQPYFLAAKLSVKPVENVEVGLNLGRQAGGTGVKNGLGVNLRGLIGGTDSDNTNSLAGVDLRIRLPYLRNTEIYGEFSGEDSASFWPIVESYVAGIFIPRLTADGRDDLRFEYFRGNNILYTNGTFPEGYLYQGIPIGHSQGGATEDYFVRYSHWFTVRNNIALEYFFTTRGTFGRIPGQAVERKDSWRSFWTLPLWGDFDVGLMYGRELINNFNLVGGAKQTNQIFKADVSYRY
jgi:hypothetical protein